MRESEKEQYQCHAIIEGRVQGVGFRYHVLKTADGLSLTGWVRNLRDGRVEVLAEGDLESLNRLLASLRKGPLGADVTDVDYQFGEAKGEFSQFNLRPTA